MVHFTCVYIYIYLNVLKFKREISKETDISLTLACERFRDSIL